MPSAVVEFRSQNRYFSSTPSQFISTVESQRYGIRSTNNTFPNTYLIGSGPILITPDSTPYPSACRLPICDPISDGAVYVWIRG